MNTPPGASASWICLNIFFSPASPQFSWIHFVTDRHRKASTDPGANVSSRMLLARKVTPPSDGPESANWMDAPGDPAFASSSLSFAAATRVAGCDLSVPPAASAASLADASAASCAASFDSRSAFVAALAAARRIRRSFSRAFFTSHSSMSMPNMVVDPNETAMDSDTSPSLHPTSTHLLRWNHSRFKCAMRWSSSDSPTR
mmetsp:Transcript_4329/g.16214  ORF Transcript_4329/g.16214 Transcript_4329/m.16214 type:complete len:201 (-) Transcript_4329:12-614(-)